MINKTEKKFNKITKLIKKEFENCIRTATFSGKKYLDGNKAKEGFIRSQKLIGYIHEFVKQELIEKKIDPSKIHPPLGQDKPEINLSGFLKNKNQDICIIPESLKSSNSKMIKKGAIALTSNALMEKSIIINVRSQLSSLAKNYDTLYERTFAEPLNLHLKNLKLCMGEIYLIPVYEYDDKAMKKNAVKFKSITKLEKYIAAFEALNNRIDYKIHEYKYERIWLVIVDFRKTQPKLYSTIQELVADNLISHGTKVNLGNLSMNGFLDGLFKIYDKRFGISRLH